MSDEIRIVIRDDQLQQFMMRVQSGAALRAGLLAGALYLKGVFAEYPSDANAHRPQPFVSERQRRYFFAALRRGEIDVPYRRGQSARSETLSKRWGISEREGGAQVDLGNSASYAPWLVGPRQSRYHRETGWRTVNDMVQDNADPFREQVTAAFMQAAKGRS